jgi:hypothetical protein
MYFTLSEVLLKIVVFLSCILRLLQVITSIYKYFVPKKGFKLKIDTCDDCDSNCSPVPVAPDHDQTVSAVSLPQYTMCIRWTQGWLIEVKVFNDVTPCDLSRTHSTDISKNTAATF